MSARSVRETQHAFDAARIMRWATFSGDYNPIHLDPAAARRVGANDVVVHGMVPMMLAIQAADRWVEGDDEGWRHCRIRLKRPVLKDAPTVISLSAGSSGVRFEVRSAHDRASHMSGTLKRSASLEPRVTEAGDRTFRLSPLSLPQQTAITRVKALDVVFPEVSSVWVRLSAVLFSEFLMQHLPALERATTAWASELGLSTEGALVVQTSYAVSANERAFRGLSAEELSTYHCTAEPAAVFRLDQSYLGDCWLRAYADDVCVMELGIGLLLRIAPPNE
jgi:hypothetical protein